MAQLLGCVRDRESCRMVETRLEISPVKPSADGPRDAYVVQVGPNHEGRSLGLTLILQGFQQAHSDIMHVAEMFAEAESLFDIDNRFAGRISLTNTLWWADVWIVRASWRRERSVDVYLYLYDRDPRSSPQEGWCGDRCTLFVVGAALEDTIQFGNDLLHELIDAWNQRRILGLSVDDEDEVWTEYFANNPKWSHLFPAS